jgi:hypothetical protein
MNQLSFFDPPEVEAEPAAIKPAVDVAQLMLQTHDFTRVANFATLSGELAAAEAEAFGDKLPADLGQKHSRLIATLSAGGNSRLQVAIALAEYKGVCKAKKQWVRCGTPIVRAMGRNSVNSLNNLIRDGEMAAQLPHELLAAVIEAGIEPVEHKYGAYLKELQALNFSSGADEARVIVERTFAQFTTKKREAAQRKKKESKQADSNSAARIANQFDASLRNCGESDRPELLKSIVHHVNAKARKLFPNCKIFMEWTAGDSLPSSGRQLVKARPMPPPKEIPNQLPSLEA